MEKAVDDDELEIDENGYYTPPPSLGGGGTVLCNQFDKIMNQLKILRLYDF